jgi:hypothetical protein
VPRVQLRPTAPVVLGKRPGEANRNLSLGIVAVLLSTPLAGIAFSWAPRETFVAATTSLLLALVMFLALQLHLLLQRHGTFVLLSLGLLLTLAVPVGVRLGSIGLDWMSDVSELRASRSGQSPENVASPVFVQGGARASQVAAPGARQTVSAPVPLPEPSVQADGATQAGNASAAPGQEAFSPEAAKRAEQALLEQLLAKLSREDPQTATRMAQKEMQRRYPALEDPSSKQATLYREAYNELGRLRKFEFFKDPVWPLKIAEMLAAREGWKRADLAAAPASPTGAGAPAEERAASVPSALSITASPAGAAGVKALPGEDLALDGPEAAPAEDSHTQEVKRAMIEARKRYPAIGVEGSDQNRAYVEVYEELDKLRPDFFSKGDWPIRLVELVAKREGWKRALEPKSGAGTEGGELPLPK